MNSRLFAHPTHRFQVFAARVESYCNTVQHAATRCNTLQSTRTYQNTLHSITLTRTHRLHVVTIRAGAHCITLQHAATRCNTLQHVAKIWTHRFQVVPERAACLCHTYIRSDWVWSSMMSENIYIRVSVCVWNKYMYMCKCIYTYVRWHHVW